MKHLSLLIAGLFVVTASHATVCKNGKAERKVEVVYEAEGKKVPCSVKYTKDQEEKTIFNASTQEGFCEEKAKSFEEKLTGMGYTCESK